MPILRRFGVRIALGVVYFSVGLLVTAQLLGLPGRDIAIAFIAGAVGGVTMLLVTMSNSVERGDLRRRLHGAS